LATLLTFDQVLKSATKKPHVLLGNGFSRACRDDIFAYDALFDRADFKKISPFGRKAFDILGTTDFETVMRALRNASALVSLYEGKETDLSKQFAEDAELLKEVLVQAIAQNHPEYPDEIGLDRYASCRAFLGHFDRIFTVNYDLLLYWALMRQEMEPSIPCDDGFRTPESGKEAYVSWEPENTDHQNVYYLHGALHIFDSKTEIQKYTWVNTGIRLIDQIRAALDEGKYPLFVAEGESLQKIERIRHSDFLDKALRSLMRVGGALVIYGHSLADNDTHILKAIAKSKVNQVFVGIYGDPESAGNRQIRSKALLLPDWRKKKKELYVDFFDASSVAVWG
jgi:hypothetical protein